MGDATANPVYVGLLCVARCLVPLLLLFGVSYLLRRLGVNCETTSASRRKPIQCR